ncbi:hypothetical protein K1T35_47845 (plasmid) [Pseudonocardia sp. DSM 110487]|uniref:hypothetical protein n=1 Tax=Pseudonocardia sp. DSM 110487 TaxID=2865833 RepID=UPI001C697A18|nr:hypothetical protein [Pseudonocardia sp. DSM 110487]QYN41064.1 hypothetical protein K1T35_47845 [Pseudonocardia sp. DSM 110487]
MPPPGSHPHVGPLAPGAVPAAHRHPPLLSPPGASAPHARPSAPVGAPAWSGPAAAQPGDRRAQELPTRRTPPRALPTGPAPRADAAADASAVAAAFGVDFLSWDETDPGRRGRALAPYVAPNTREEQLAAAGWSGRGRQRAELALSGTVVRLNTLGNRLLVHVRVRVTPFRRIGAGAAIGRDTTDVLPFPAAAPAPADPDWEALESYWYELLIPVFEVEERWRVDLREVIVVPPVLPILDLAGHRGGAPSS